MPARPPALLAVYEVLRNMDRVDRLLVVAPKNASISWDEEVESCYQNDLDRPCAV